MRDSYPGHNKKPGVHRDLVEIGEAFLFRPSQMPIPHPDVPGSRAEPYARNRLVVREGDIFEVLADGLGITEIVMLLNKTLVESFPRSAPHHEDGER